MLVLAAIPSTASAARNQESMFQDDPLLVYGTSEQVDSTLETLQSFGVDRIRVSMFWRVVAPANDQRTKPNFDASDPAHYPAAHWAPYDRLIQAAQARGIAINLNFTSPVPRWASGESPRADIQETFGPNADEFGLFVRAVARRYSGDYAGLPRIDYWSIWNEPNQAGWLTPQWSPDPRRSGRWVDAAPSLYRALVAAAWSALQDTGHGGDTILVGDTAPQGERNDRELTQSIDALKFVRRLYCLDDNLNIYRGANATLRGCPADRAAFVEQNPALFRATGYAHHPYALLTPPGRRSSWPDWVSISDLRTLSRELARIYQRYGQSTQTSRGVPLYITEYGYQTRPDPFSVSYDRQAAWINQAEYIAYKNPLVRSMSQFLLVDDGPVPNVDPRRHPRLAWRTFQSGLQSISGRRKPSYRAYMTPLFVKQSRIRRGGSTGIFGMLRPAPTEARPRVRIQFRARGRTRWQTRKTLTVGGPKHGFETRVRVPGSGSLRIRWRHGSRTLTSRAASVTAG